MKFIDQHKKLLDSMMLDKLKLDEEVKTDEEKATKEVRNAEIGSNINVMPYQIYTMLCREEAKHIGKKITMLEYLKAKPIGIPKDVEVRSQRDSMNYCGKIITKLAKRMGLLTDAVLNSMTALTYCKALDATTLRELIDSEGRLIDEDPTPRVPRVAMPRGLRPSMQDLYDKMGNMEIRQGTLERMARRELMHHLGMMRRSRRIRSGVEMTLLDFVTVRGSQVLKTIF
nr:hypothetical protein [Tanacetum cinerariifolium]